MKIKSIFLIFSFLLFLPTAILAEDNSKEVADDMFKAKVIEVLEQNNVVRDNGSTSIQQKLKIKAIEGSWKNQEIFFDGTQVDLLSAGVYQVGDVVWVNYSPGPDGENNFFVVGFSRANGIYWLAFLFAVIVAFVGRTKGLRALFVLILTFLIISNYIVPKILSGSDPIFISIVGSFFILLLSVYVTEGFKRTSSVAIFSILLSLIITGLFSIWFSAVTKLTGFASEETTYLLELAGGNLNIKGLLLAGIIIGALGVLDDVVISQVALVEELKKTNPGLTKSQIYYRAMRVGVSHLSSMVNTLFLAYAGAALPLLILFSLKQPPFLTFGQIIDNEAIATEIVRTLTGSIGLVLAVPLATFFAIHFVKIKKYN